LPYPIDFCIFFSNWLSLLLADFAITFGYKECEEVKPILVSILECILKVIIPPHFHFISIEIQVVQLKLAIQVELSYKAVR
jgi:hypothetical protein